MLKRIFALSLALMLCVFSFAACNEEKPDEQGNDSNTNIFTFKKGDVTIELGKNATNVLSALGDASNVKELGDCGGLGAQIKYTYSGFDLYTLKSGNEETIDQITFTSDTVQTPKGIYLGVSKDTVLEKYGKATKSDDSEIRYTSGNLTLKFTLKDGKVSEINYIRTTN